MDFLALIDPAKLAEPLFKTSIQVKYPKAEIRIKSEDLCDDLVVANWTGKIRWTLPISELIIDFNKEMESRKKCILKPYLSDGKNHYYYQSEVGRFVDDIKEFKRDFTDGINRIADEYETIKSDFQDDIYDQLFRAVTRHKSNDDIPDKEKLVTDLIDHYMDKTFPSYEDIVEATGIQYEIPSPVIGAIPPGLSKDQEDELKESIKQKVIFISDLMTERYKDLEKDAALAHMEELVHRQKAGKTFQFFDELILCELNYNDELKRRALKLEEDEADSMDKPLRAGHGKRLIASAEIEDTVNEQLDQIAAIYRERKNYTLASHKSIRKRCDSISTEIQKSLQMYQEHGLDLSYFDLILSNIKLFDDLSNDWMINYEAEKKIKKIKSTGKPGRPTNEQAQTALDEIELNEEIKTNIDLNQAVTSSSKTDNLDLDELNLSVTPVDVENLQENPQIDNLTNISESNSVLDDLSISDINEPEINSTQNSQNIQENADNLEQLLDELGDDLK